MSGPVDQRGPIEVHMIADLACPWCHLGLVRLDGARRLRPNLAVRLVWWPYFLNPEMPPEGMDRATYLRLKVGGEAAARRVYQRIGEAGRAEAIPFAFERMPRTPNTLLAHRLVLEAQVEGLGEPVIRALFVALFQDGRDIGDRAELLAIAEETGLERGATDAMLASARHEAEVGASHRQAESLGVQGVPVFVVDRRHAIAGAQSGEVLAGLLDVAAAAPAESGPTAP
jgi:predicted DsbA family dithiol-disulfide isomerase